MSTQSRFNTSDPVLIGDSGATSDGSTKTKTAQQCFKKFQFAYTRGIFTPRSKNPVYFSVGSIFGACRASWFNQKFASDTKAWTKIKHAAQAEAERSRLPIDPDDEAQGLNLFEEYMLYWMKRPLPRPVATELKVGPHPSLPLTGSLDDLSYYSESGGQLAIGECKTTAGDLPTSHKEYEFHTQTLQYQALYMLNEEYFKKWGPIKCHILDVTKKPESKGGKPGKPAFARFPIDIRPLALKQFIQATRATMKFANEITWDSNPVRSYQCTFQAGRARVDCEFKKLCMYGESGAGGYVLKDGSSLRDHKPKKGKEKMPWE